MFRLLSKDVYSAVLWGLGNAEVGRDKVGGGVGHDCGQVGVEQEAQLCARFKPLLWLLSYPTEATYGCGLSEETYWVFCNPTLGKGLQICR